MASQHVANESSVLDEPTLVDQLNTLLSSLNIPITLISPTDLTPSLLIAILESILSMRIPLVDRSQQAKYSKAAKIQNMKIFLGFLEIDVMKTDVGLSDIDPRRLADGEWEEVSFVAELLCWMGRRKGLIQKTEKENSVTIISREERYPSPGQLPPLSPKSQLDQDAISLFQTGSTVTGNIEQESFTTLDTGGHEDGDEPLDSYSDNVSDVLSALPPFNKSNMAQPQGIHEVPGPSLLFSRDFDQPSPAIAHSNHHTTRTVYSKNLPTKQDANSSNASNIIFEPDHWHDHSNSSVRYSGFIEPVDEESEIASFEHSRSLSLDHSRSTEKARSVKIETVKEQYARTRELLNERARLLNQLADLKISHG